MTTQALYKYIRYFAVFGLFLAGYLLYLYFFHPTSSICYINSKVNCNLVTTGALATLFGIPVGLYGFVGFATILAGTFLKQSKLILGMAIFGFLFCARMLYFEIFVYSAYCPVCLMCMFTMISEIILSVRLSFTKFELK